MSDSSRKRIAPGQVFLFLFFFCLSILLFGLINHIIKGIPSIYKNRDLFRHIRAFIQASGCVISILTMNPYMLNHYNKVARDMNNYIAASAQNYHRPARDRQNGFAMYRSPSIKDSGLSGLMVYGLNALGMPLIM